jgi:GNAT superfamily N-acetyltransferase
LAKRKAPEPISADELITVRPLKTKDWNLVAHLFGEKGACGGCWCMWWRVPRGGKLWQESKGAVNRDNFRKLIAAGKVHAVLAFAGGEPVGWCCFGPRNTFPRLERVRALQRVWSDGTWSVVCFYIHSKWRSRGVASKMLEEATARAFALGAREIEGFPIVPKEPGGSIPAVFAYTGVPALFEKNGYGELPRPGVSRPIFLNPPP